MCSQDAEEQSNNKSQLTMDMLKGELVFGILLKVNVQGSVQNMCRLCRVRNRRCSQIIDAERLKLI